MPLKQKHIDELIGIYRRQTGNTLSNEEAWAMAHRLVTVFEIMLKVPADKKIQTSSDLPKKRGYC